MRCVLSLFLLFVVCVCCLSVVRSSLSVVRGSCFGCWLFVVCCLSGVVCWLLCVMVSCPLFVRCCSSFFVG